MEETGERWKLTGSSKEMAAVGPSPGSTPTNVPMKTPRKQNMRFIGWKATCAPCSKNPKMSVCPPSA